MWQGIDTLTLSCHSCVSFSSVVTKASMATTLCSTSSNLVSMVCGRVCSWHDLGIVKTVLMNNMIDAYPPETHTHLKLHVVTNDPHLTFQPTPDRSTHT